MNFVVSAQTNWPMYCLCTEGLSNRLDYVKSTHRQTLTTVVEQDQTSHLLTVHGLKLTIEDLVSHPLVSKTSRIAFPVSVLDFSIIMALKSTVLVMM